MVFLRNVGVNIPQTQRPYWTWMSNTWMTVFKMVLVCLPDIGHLDFRNDRCISPWCTAGACLFFSESALNYPCHRRTSAVCMSHMLCKLNLRNQKIRSGWNMANHGTLRISKRLQFPRYSVLKSLIPSVLFNYNLGLIHDASHYQDYYILVRKVHPNYN